MFEKITIIGIGLIGSSLARVIKKEKLTNKLVAVDKNKIFLEKAKDLKIVDETYLEIKDGVKGSDLIILATPIKTYGELTKEIVKFVENGIIITDVGSVKKNVIEEIEKNIGNRNIIFVGGHPIAGSQKSGPEFGFAEVFENKYCILTPSKKSTDEAVKKISEIWKKAKMKVEIMDAKKHDEILAIVSHFPHLLAFTMMEMANDIEEKEKQEILKYSSSGFKDFTRIAGAEANVWRDIFLTNKNEILKLVNLFIDDLTKIKEYLNSNESEKIFDFISKAREDRKKID